MSQPLAPKSRSSSLRRDGLNRPRRGRSVIVLFILLLLWSICLGWGLAQANEPRSLKSIAQAPEVAEPGSQVAPATEPATEPGAEPAAVGTVDPVPARLKNGERLYLATCATCHVGIPPEVMPSETWRQLLPDPEHYGLELKPLDTANLRVTWEYLRTFSRPQAAEETIPYRIYQSRYFKALHPQVKLPVKAGLNTCVSCHPGAGAYNFRKLSAEWQNAP